MSNCWSRSFNAASRSLIRTSRFTTALLTVARRRRLSNSNFFSTPTRRVSSAIFSVARFDHGLELGQPLALLLLVETFDASSTLQQQHQLVAKRAQLAEYVAVGLNAPWANCSTHAYACLCRVQMSASGPSAPSSRCPACTSRA
eukprot:6202689-Pleurochrysis_carterae.AAC.3